MALKGHTVSEETRKKISESLKGNIPWNKGIPQSEETRQKNSENHKGRSPWNKGKTFSEESKRKMSLAHMGKSNGPFSEEHRQKISAALRGKPKPTLRGKHRPAEVGEKISKSSMGHVVSEETRRKFSEMNKGRPGYWKGKHMPEEACKKMSIAHKGEKNLNWRQGSSYAPYCPEFNDALKERVRDNFNRCCGLCGLPENGKKMSVHHIDYNKMQGCGKHRRWNLIPLCQWCHPKTNHNRWYWFLLFYNGWALNPEINF